MSEIRLDEFYEAYEKALGSGDAALFAGAGFSQPAGFVNWKELMREIAHDLGLDIDKESDLIAIAQFHQNDRTNRAKLNQKLIDEFTQDAAITENHRLIAQRKRPVNRVFPSVGRVAKLSSSIHPWEGQRWRSMAVATSIGPTWSPSGELAASRKKSSVGGEGFPTAP